MNASNRKVIIIKIYNKIIRKSRGMGKMKIRLFIIFLLLLPSISYADNYVCYDDNGRIKAKYYKIPDGFLDNRKDCIKISLDTYKKLTKWHKVVNGKIVEMTGAEKKKILNTKKDKMLIKDKKIANINITDISTLKTFEQIDNINSLNDIKIFLKKLVKYIIQERE